MKIVRFFSSEEINKAFNDADLDKNNYIDFNEFCITFKKFDDITDNIRDLMKDIFLFVDGDGFGSSKDYLLNFIEYKNCLEAQPTESESTKDFFVKMLTNLVFKNKTTINKDRFDEFYKRVFRTCEQENENQNAFDLLKNEDGLITRERFMEYIDQQ